MASETLSEKLNYTKAYRKTRLEVANWVLERPETFSELLDHCFNVKDEISYKAAWILEFVCHERLEMIYPHLDDYFKNLPKVYRDQALRPLAKVSEMLVLAYFKRKDPKLKALLHPKHKETLTECCFDWLITDQKVACEVYAMLTLFFLGTENDWIHPELQTIIKSNIHQKSPAYKSRGKYVLKQIEKFKDAKTPSS